MRKNYVVREGDTLQSVSEYYYGYKFFWWFLAIINIKSLELKADEMIRVPNKYAIAFPLCLLIAVVALVINIILFLFQ